jgi:dipeptidyl aminopeptidase/acylaminoacyl peptidase
MTRLTAAACTLLLIAPFAAAQGPATPPQDPVTLELIMADPDWIGNSPERPYWADDARSFYYTVKKPGSDARDLIQTDPAGRVLRVVADADRGSIDVPGGDWSPDYSRKVYTRNGDLFVKDIASGIVTQLTRTAEAEFAPSFMADPRRVMFRRGAALLIRDLAAGQEWQPADLRAEDDPDKKDKKDDASDYLKRQQERLFDYLKDRKRKEDEAKERDRAEREADPTRPPRPWYLGADVEIRESSLSPAGRWMLVRLVKKGADEGKRDTMPQYVTDTGYVETRGVRSKVGTGAARGETLVLLDLEKRERKDLDLSALPQITDDPLKALRDKPAEPTPDQPPVTTPAPDPQKPEQQPPEKKDEPPAKPPPAPKPRPVTITSISWSDDGSRVVVQAVSLDNKDRWIAAADLDEARLIPLEHDRDPAWINWGFARLGWLKDNTTIWFLSERTGYAHLYLRTADAIDAQARPLTAGAFEVSDPVRSRDGRFLYYTANAAHPGATELWRVATAAGEPEPLTSLGGQNAAILSPDQRTLLITHSTATRPPELFVQPIGGAPVQATHTVSDRFTSIAWVDPKIVEVPSRHGRPIYARLYTSPIPTDNLRPGVLFVHGAGYLQDAHAGWSYYFREFMFHTLLVRRGYVVLDMDYRASAGYGRDWRTAIYSHMGDPELEDLEDGVRWLAQTRSVDPNRVGVYGGSYGGFLTLMALFTRPDLFACGAALRPVTDWAHYNHGYTANILDTPALNPEAYERSSPIEFAAGLKRPLLICHGMQDDNVFFQDTVRLAQRLIELGKQDWEVAMYPVESHAFTTPASWLDEYRRILKLFEANLRR